MLFRLLITLCLLSVPGASLFAADWGTLKGQVLFDGEIPKVEKLDLNRDIEYCSKNHPASENLLIDSKSRGVKNVVVYLYLSRKAEAPPVHPDYTKSSEDKILIDNKDCVFKPHVTLLRTSQTLEIINNDEVSHNTAAYLIRNNPFNVVTPVGKTEYKQVKKRESRPVQVSCSIHPWMRGWLLVQDHPYMAVTDEQGKFEIPNLPAGEWTFQFWHEATGYLKEITLNGEPTQWERGRTELKITSAGIDLKEIKISAENIIN